MLDMYGSIDYVLHELNCNDFILREDVAKFYSKKSVENCGFLVNLPQEEQQNENNNAMVIQYYDETLDAWLTMFSLKNLLERALLKKKDFIVANSIKVQPKRHIPAYIVVDNFYDDPLMVRNFALSQEFQYHPDYHKGKRTDAVYRFDGLKERFEECLGLKIKNWDKYGVNGCFQYCIAGDQTVYHF